MASIDKEIQIIMLKGKTGASSYEDAVKHQLFSGTLAEWIETFATPDNYITRLEFQKVTQEEYDALEEAGQLISNCYYVITDDDSWATMQQLISDVADLQESMGIVTTDLPIAQEDISDLKTRMETAENDIDNLETSVGNAENDIDRIDQSISDIQSDILALQRKTETPTINVCNSLYSSKIVTTSYNLPLAEGTQIYIKFANYGSSDIWTNMYLNVNDTGLIPIYAQGSLLTSNDYPAWSSGDIVKLVYEYNALESGYVWNVQENVTQHIYFGTLYNRDR